MTVKQLRQELEYWIKSSFKVGYEYDEDEQFFDECEGYNQCLNDLQEYLKTLHNKQSLQSRKKSVEGKKL